MVNELLVVKHTSVAGDLHSTINNNHNNNNFTNAKVSITRNSNINNHHTILQDTNFTSRRQSCGKETALVSNNYTASQMSSEPIKIELDCARNAYRASATTTSNVHHHHDRLNSHHPHSIENNDELIVDENDDDELVSDDDYHEEEDDDANEDDEIERASDDSGSGTSSSVESSTSGTSSAAGCSDLSSSSLANAYSNNTITARIVDDSTVPNGDDYGNNNIRCLKDNGGIHNCNGIESIQCIQVERLSLSHLEHQNSRTDISEHHFHVNNNNDQVIDHLKNDNTILLSQNDCSQDQNHQHQQLNHKHGYNLQSSCYQLLHPSDSSTNIYQTHDGGVIDTKSSINNQVSHDQLIDKENPGNTFSGDPSSFIDNNTGEDESNDDDDDDEDEDEDEVDGDEDDDVYEDIEDGDAIDDDDDDEEEEDEEEEDEDYVIANNQESVSDRCLEEDDDDNVDEDDDTEVIEDGNQVYEDDDDNEDESVGDNTNHIHPEQSNLSLDGERMLEVTRKLVRSTERDPDRDLRKQVLLKTAIKKLPHFMEYNRYSESLNHNLHLNGGANAPVNCMSPSQAAYYELHHHHHHHHNLLLTSSHPNQDDHLQLDSQHKSFYYSVQPNAIQMSTTGLRMLDLNDDHESDSTINETIRDNNTGSCPKQDIILQGYDNRTCLENTSSHDFEPPLISHHQTEPQTHLYDRYSQLQQTHAQEQVHHGDTRDQSNQLENNHELSHQEVTNESDIGDNHLDNLYTNTNNENSDISATLKSDERIPVAFQVACDVCDFNCVPGNCGKKLHIQDPASTDQTKNPSANLTMHNMSNHNGFETQLKDDGETKDPLLSGHVNHNDSGISGYCEDLMDEVDAVNRNESNNSSSSQDSSNDSNDSVNLDQSIPQSFLETVDAEHSLQDDSLNQSLHTPHDSGVSIFSPRSNKRSSSSIGLDDEMEIDNLTELSPTQNSTIGSNISQYKKLRKREAIE